MNLALYIFKNNKWVDTFMGNERKLRVNDLIDISSCDDGWVQSLQAQSLRITDTATSKIKKIIK